MVGRFLFGLLSGGALVVAAFVLGSVLFPIAGDTAKSGAEGQPAATPEPEVQPEKTSAPEPTETVTTAEEPAAEPPAAAESAAASTEAPAETALAALPNEAPSPTPGVEPAPSAGQSTAEPSPASPPTDPAAAGTEETAPAEAPAPVAEAAPEAPAAPEGEAEAKPETAAADLPEPEVTAEPAAPPADPEPVAEPAAPSAPDPAPETAAESTPEPEPAVVAEAPPATDSTPPAAPEAAPEAAPDVVTPPAAMPATEGADLPGTPAEPLPEPEVATLPAPATEEAAPDATFEPSPGLAGDDGVIVGRLPRVGDAAQDGTEAAEAPPEDPRPLVRFAAPFDNPEGKPLLAVVLIDPGTADLDRAALAALPYPVAIALDPLDPATPERAALYRAGGKEVVMLATGIADGAQASDIEVAFQEMGRGLPESVAVMDVAQEAFQSSRPLASLVVPVVGAQGRGLLTWDQGLNAADQVARRDDIPAAVIFRDFATGGGDRGAIRRLLDRAVFKAGQDGHVVLAGTASADLVAALLEWAVEGRAATVAFAPVSAVLTVE